MLQKLRDKTSGWIATAVLGLLIVPFAFVGVNEYMGGGSDNSVAKVEAPPTWWQSAPHWWPLNLLWQHEEVTQDQFRESFEQARAQQRQSLGENFDPREFETQENKLKVLDQLVDRKVLELTAKRSGVQVSDEAVRKAIANEPAFQVDGKFNATRYESMLASQVPSLTPLKFQNDQRDRLQLALIPQGISDSGFITPKEMDRLIKLLGETRDVTIAAMPAPTIDGVAVTDAQIKAWYDGHAGEYKQGESVTLEYVEVDGSKLAATTVAADDKALMARYEQEKSRFMSAEQRLVAHILVAVPPGADAATQKVAEQKATALATQAKQPGAEFAALAKANSDDTGSKAAGGELPWSARNGTYAKPFEDAMFTMQAGEVRGPVKTEFGYHVLKLNDIRPGKGKAFEEVRADLAREQAEADGDHAYSDVAGRLVNEILKNPTALGPAAKAVDLPVQRIGPFARATASGIAAIPAVLRAAFSDTLVQDGTVSDPIEIGPRHSVVIRVLQHTPEHAQPLAQVRDAVIGAIRADRTAKAAEVAADALLARVIKGENLKTIATAEKMQTGDLPGIPRGAPMPSPEINAAIFAAQRPATGKVSTGKARMETGGYAVFVVNKVNEGDLGKITPEQRTQLQQQVVQMDGGTAVESFVGSLRKQYKITRREDRL